MQTSTMKYDITLHLTKLAPIELIDVELNLKSETRFDELFCLKACFLWHQP